jgi:hypothetical protein
MHARRAILIIGFFVAAHAAHAQAPASPPAGKSLAATLNVYVFPSAGQVAAQQSKDEAECYQWAVGNTGSDPFDVQKQQAAQAQQTEAAKQQAAESMKGAGVKGAVGGAAVGALVGEIASDDAGEGAAWGAVVGTVAARRRAKSKAATATEQAEAQGQQAQQASGAQVENFKKAFSVCLEAKKYMVKY